MKPIGGLRSRIIEIADFYGGQLVEGSIIGTTTNYSTCSLICIKQHTWTALVANIIYKKSWCPECYKEKRGATQRLTIYDCHILAQMNGGLCLSEVYVNSTTKLKWRCCKGHVWETSYSKVKMGHWCPECANVRVALKRTGSIENCQVRAVKWGLECLSSTYISARTLYEWRGPCNHTWKATMGNVKQGTGCPHCTRKSKPELQVYHYIKRLFSGAKSRKTGVLIKNKRMELDVWVPLLRKAIEFDGDYWHSRPEAMRRDAIKDQLCKEANIDLLRIKESEFKAHRNKTYKKIREFLET